MSSDTKGPIMTPDELSCAIGQELGVSQWMVVDQARIDAFADITDDHQFIHVDPQGAAKTPLGGTVAHGFLTLSLLSAMSYDALPDLDGAVMGLNYGFDRLRFVSPVPAGARLRGHFVLADVARVNPQELSVAWDVTVEIEGQARPALVARWLHRQYFAP